MSETEQQPEPAVESTGLVARLSKLLLNRQMDVEEYSVSGTTEQWGNAVQDVAALHRSIGIVERYDEKSRLLAEIENQSATVKVSHRTNGEEAQAEPESVSNPPTPVDSTGLVARNRSQPETVYDWLDKGPEWDDACRKLIQLIRNDSPKSELLEVAEYIEEFFQDDDPVSMGWVGSDGRP